MPNPLLEHLTFLYGPSAADLLRRIDALTAKYRPRLSTARSGGHVRLTERDTILISYADQVQSPGAGSLATLTEFLERHVTGVVSGIHLLPFYPSSSDDGFAVEDYQRVDPGFGDWDDVHRLGRSFDLMFDAVFNHLSARSHWFQRFLQGDPVFGEFFVTVEGDPDLSCVIRPRARPLLTEFESTRGPIKVWTTFSPDQVDLNLGNPEVLLALLEVLLFYVLQGARFIRLDAVAFLWKRIGTACLHLPQTHQIIQVMRKALDAAAAHVLLITETNVPHAENISYFGDGSNEAQLVYNFALPPLVLSAMANGTAEKLTGWAQTLFLPSDRVAFFNFLASHDGIGLNPVRGILDESELGALEARTISHRGLISDKVLPDGSRAAYELNISYFDALSNPHGDEPLELQVARFICAHAILLSFPGVPGLYFHSLFGSRGDRAGAEASGIPRRINREKLPRDTLEAELAHPWSLRGLVFGHLKRMLQARRSHRAFAPSGPFSILALDRRVFSIQRLDPGSGDPLLCLHNVSGCTVEQDISHAGIGSAESWRSVLASDAAEISDNRVRLPPYGWWWAEGMS